MADKDDSWQQIAWLAVASVAVIAMLVASWRLGTPLASDFTTKVFRGGLALLVGSAGLITVGVTINKTYTLVLSGFKHASQQYPEQVKAVKQHTPIAAVAAGLAGNAVLTAAGVSFPTNAEVTIGVSLALFLGFWVANELFLKKSKPLRILGWALWALLLLLLPAAVLIDNDWSVAHLLSALMALSLPAKIFFPTLAVSLAVLPILTARVE